MDNHVTNDDRWNILIDLVKEARWWEHQRTGVLLDLEDVYDIDAIRTTEDLDTGIAVLSHRIIRLADGRVRLVEEN